MALRKKRVIAAASVLGILIAAWLLFTYIYCSEPEIYLVRFVAGHNDGVADMCCSDFVSDWIRTKRHYSLAQVESVRRKLANLCRGKDCRNVQYEMRDADWKRFAAQYRDGDVLRFYIDVSGDRYSSSFADGYFIERDGKRIADFSLMRMFRDF